MKLFQSSLMLVGCLGVAVLAGCSSGSTPSSTMNVRLVDGPINGFQEVNVNIQTVEISSGGGWISLGAPKKTINLLSLVGGVEETLASGASLPAGHYQQMRLMLGSGNTVKLADGTTQPLTVPSGLQTGIKLIVSFDVKAGTTKDVFIDFDAAHSIQVVGAGASGSYILRPTVSAFDKVVTGSVSGTFTDTASNPLVGAMVYAETLDGSGKAGIVRSAVTNASGQYTLNLLPIGGTFYIVSQPVVGAISYDAKASAAQNVTSSSAVLTYNASFTADALVGAVSGSITPLPTANQADTVNLAQSLSTGSGSFSFIVRSSLATMVSTTSETYSFTGVPVASYTVLGVRTTTASDGSTITSSSASTPITITASGTVVANIAM